MSYDFTKIEDVRSLGARYALKSRTTRELEVVLKAHHVEDALVDAAFDSYFFMIDNFDAVVGEAAV